MRQFFIILKMDLLNLAKSFVLVQYNTLFPIALILILGFLCQGDYGGGGVTSYDYYGVTMLLFTVLNVSVSAANSFMEKSIRSSNLRIVFSPVRTSFIYISKIVATFLFTSLCYIAVIIFCNLVLGVNFGGTAIGCVILLILLLDLMSAAMGVLFCCLFRSEEGASQLLSMMNNVFGVLGGLFFQIDGFGKTASIISCISPAKWVLEGIMRVIYDNDLSFVLPISLIFLVLTAVFAFGCRLTFRTEDYV